MLTKQDIRNIYLNKNQLPINKPVNSNVDMTLLENQTLYWSDMNDNSHYAFLEIIKIVNESFDLLDKFQKLNIINNLNKMICLLDENTLDTILSNKIEINTELKEVLTESAKNIKYYNRVLGNINKLNKKCNFKSNIMNKLNPNNPDYIVEENISSVINSIIECYSELSTKTLYSITLECMLMSNILYHLNIPTDKLVHEITKVFVYERSISKDDIRHIIENTKIENDHSFIFYLLEANDKTKETDIGLKITKSKSIKDMIQSLELDSEKNINKLKLIVKKLYEKPLVDVVNDSPHILGFIRKFFIVGGAFAINPILAIVVGITDYCIENNMNRESADKYLKNLESEKKKAEKKLDTLKSEKYIENTKKYIEELDDNIYKVEQYISNLKSDKEDEFNIDESVSMIKSMGLLLAIEKCLDEHISEASLVESVITESKIVNNLKLAGENLKSKLKSLSGKEKLLSQKLDNTMDKFTKDIENALTVTRREDLVKGRILPSFSRIIKIGLVAGGLTMINPILAAISALGAIAVSKTATLREKQFILDEIDANLKIVERKINQAEINGDDKALEDLYKLELRLKRERQRIKYRLKVYYNK